MTVVGTVIGRFELLRLLAVGGMGEVYLASQRSSVEGFSTLVAIKMLLRNLGTNRTFVRMFLDEARIVGGLHHKNIVQVRDVAQHQGQYFMVMEYIPGQNLRELLGDATIRDRPLFEPRLGAEVFAGIADALGAAHDAGLVHRDISPNNIMIGDDGVAKLIDFGVARALGAASLTTPGTLKGKFGYMAPEYVRNQTYDHRVDVFSLGVVMWETFARRRLFRGPNEAAQMHQLLEAPIPLLSDEIEGFPRELAALVASAIERDPSRRIASAAELATALGELANALPVIRDVSLRQWLLHRIANRLEDRRQTDEMLRSLPPGSPIPDFAPEVDVDPGSVPMTYNYRQSGFVTSPQSGSRPSGRTKEAPAPDGTSGTSIRLANGETAPPPVAVRSSRRGIWLGGAALVVALVIAFVMFRPSATVSTATAVSDEAPANPDMSLAEAHRQIGLKAMADGDYVRARSEYAEAIRAGGGGDLMQLMEMASQLETEAAERARVAAAPTAPSAIPPAAEPAIPPAAEPAAIPATEPTGSAAPEPIASSLTATSEPATRRTRPTRPTRPTRASKKPERASPATPKPAAAVVAAAPPISAEPRPTPPPATTGDLVVTSIVPKALVRVDGKVMGQTPVRVLVEPGNHQLEVSAGAQRLKTQAISIVAGDTTVVHVEQPAPATVTPAPPDTTRPDASAPAKRAPSPTPRVTGTGDVATGARAIGACNRCHAESSVARISSRRYTRVQWSRFFATGQHDRYVPIGDRMTAAQLVAVKAYLSANAADTPENQGAGIRE